MKHVTADAQVLKRDGLLCLHRADGSHSRDRHRTGSVRATEISADLESRDASAHDNSALVRSANHVAFNDYTADPACYPEEAGFRAACASIEVAPDHYFANRCAGCVRQAVIRSPARNVEHALHIALDLQNSNRSGD